MSVEPSFKVTANCGHSNRFISPLPKPGEPVYCYRCADYQVTVFVDFPMGLTRAGRLIPKLRQCKRGHEFTEANTYVTKQGKRVCRSCAAERDRKNRKPRTDAQRAKRKAARIDPANS